MRTNTHESGGSVDLRLVEPTEELEGEARGMAEEWRRDGSNRYDAILSDFPGYLATLRRYKEGRDLPPEHVQQTLFWLVRGRRILGIGRLRHSLLPHLEKRGGHIGYEIRPSERRKGYGTTILRLLLEKAQALGLTRVLVTCDKTNVASAKIIEKNGGRKSDEVLIDETGYISCRYWIELQPSDAAGCRTPGDRLRLPESFDVQSWLDRWDRMQERYLVGRAERLETMARLICDTQPEARLLLDIGCGTGSVMECLLRALPDAQVVGVDFDPTLLLLAAERLAKYSGRVLLVKADLRQPEWWAPLPRPFDAVVSATALHWLTPGQLETLYSQLATLLRPGGLFLNADHVGSEHAAVQRSWETHREAMRQARQLPQAEDWGQFWTAYSAAVGFDRQAVKDELSVDWKNTVEQGMPLAWHMDRLRAAGFTAVDCFWRSDCDAIYGGIRAAL